MCFSMIIYGNMWSRGIQVNMRKCFDLLPGAFIFLLNGVCKFEVWCCIIIKREAFRLVIPEPCLSLSFHTRRHSVCLALSPWTSPSQLRGQRERTLQTAVTWRWSDASKEGKTFLFRPRFRNQHKHANKFVRHNVLFYDPHSVQHALLWNSLDWCSVYFHSSL